jgi:hypothetical protein
MIKDSYHYWPLLNAHAASWRRISSATDEVSAACPEHKRHISHPLLRLIFVQRQLKASSTAAVDSKPIPRKPSKRWRATANMIEASGQTFASPGSIL